MRNALASAWHTIMIKQWWLLPLIPHRKWYSERGRSILKEDTLSPGMFTLAQSMLLTRMGHNYPLRWGCSSVVLTSIPTPDSWWCEVNPELQCSGSALWAPHTGQSEGIPALNRVERDREKALEVSGDVEKRKRNWLEIKTEHFWRVATEKHWLSNLEESPKNKASSRHLP